MTETNLHSAVQNQKLTSGKGFLQKLFAIWFDAFVYNQIWEDPRVDIAALDIRPDSDILTISSGGCNALNYLLEEPASVTAVDLNRNHIYLLELKAAAIKNLPSHAKFFSFFGAGKGPDTTADYFRYLRSELDPACRVFWESNTLGGSLVYGDRIGFFRDAGLYEHSRNGYFLRFFHKLAKLFGLDPSAILDAGSADDQARSFERHVGPFFDKFPVRVLGNMPVTLFGLGIPPQQYDELRKDVLDGSSLIDIYKDRTRRLACDYPIEENYFAWQAFGRRYDVEKRIALPEYLKDHNFEKLRANIHRLESHIGSATEVISSRPEGSFDRFVFLDAQDWMDAETITTLWSAIAEKARPGSRIIFRTAGAGSPIENALPAKLRERFRYEPELSQQLFQQDRASIYGGFHLYIFEG